MSYNVGPFLPRLLDVPTQVIVAEKDDLTLWDLEIEAYNRSRLRRSGSSSSAARRT